jgi:hypothetical protein
VTETNTGSPPKRPRCIEWTGAGGDYYLAVAVEKNEVISEHWGTKQDVLAWMDESWPGIPRKFVPMVYNPSQDRPPAPPPTPPRRPGARSRKRRAD